MYDYLIDIEAIKFAKCLSEIIKKNQTNQTNQTTNFIESASWADDMREKGINTWNNWHFTQNLILQYNNLNKENKTDTINLKPTSKSIKCQDCSREAVVKIINLNIFLSLLENFGC